MYDLITAPHPKSNPRTQYMYTHIYIYIPCTHLPTQVLLGVVLLHHLHHLPLHVGARHGAAPAAPGPAAHLLGCWLIGLGCVMFVCGTL